jgi:hypothetical protein
MKPNVSGAMVRRREQRRAARDAGPPPRIGSAVARFMLGSLLAIAVVVVGGFLALRSVAVKEAVRDTSVRVESEGRLVQTAAVDDALLHSNAASVAKLDEVVRGQVLDGSIVRVKIWARDGTILYADDHALIGRRYTLAADDRKLFDGAGPDAVRAALPAGRQRQRDGFRRRWARPARPGPRGTCRGRPRGRPGLSPQAAAASLAARRDGGGLPSANSGGQMSR